jgi:hypothetical protein
VKFSSGKLETSLLHNDKDSGWADETETTILIIKNIKSRKDASLVTRSTEKVTMFTRPATFFTGPDLGNDA